MATPLFDMVELDQAASTQDEVRRRAGGRPLLAVTGRQTEGRGRSGAVWDAAPVALAASLGVRLAWPSSAWPRTALAAGAAALRSLEAPGEYAGPGAADLSLKWPNDLMRGEDKLGGILAEAFGGLLVVGWGANLYWPDPPPGRGALFDEDPGPGCAPELARRWAERLLEFLSGGPADWPREEYRRRCSTLGQEITWSSGGAGRAVDITGEGGLLVDSPRGLITLTSGAVSEVRSSFRD